MKYSMNFIYDVFSIFKLRMKLIIKDITTFITLLVSFIIFMVMINVLNTSAEEQSALPIGVIDRDNTKESQALINRLNDLSSLKLVFNEEAELKKLLVDEMIIAMFVIEDGYEEKVTKGNLQEIIAMYYVIGNESASIISDIMVGEMIYPICLYKSYQHYNKLTFNGDKHSQEEYNSYMNELYNYGEDFDFSFDITYENPEKEASIINPITNSLIYNQLVFGILGILVAFIAMFLTAQVVKEKELGIAHRLRISRFYMIKQDIANLASIVIVESFVAAVFTYLMYNKMGNGDLRILPSSFLLIMSEAIVFGGGFILVAKLIRSIIIYQLSGSIIILIMGGMGFYNLLTGLYDNIIGSFIEFIPNSWFIRGFTDIIVYGTNTIINSEQVKLLAAGAVIIILIIVLDILSINSRKTRAIAKA